MLSRFMLVGLCSIATAFDEAAAPRVLSGARCGDIGDRDCALPLIRQEIDGNMEASLSGVSSPVDPANKFAALSACTRSLGDLAQSYIRPVEKLTAHKNTKKNQVLLCEDAEILSSFFSDYYSSEEFESGISQPEHTYFVNNISDDISVLKELKLLEVGKFDPMSSEFTNVESTLWKHTNHKSILEWLINTPPNEISSVAKHAGKELGISILNQVKREIVTYQIINLGRIILPDSAMLQVSNYVPYLFKTIDFLWKNEFIDQENLRNIFQDDRILIRRASIVAMQYYRRHKFFEDELHANFTHQWFSPFGPTFLQALTEQHHLEIKLELINEHFLRAAELRKSVWLPDEWREFHNTFSINIYIDQLKNGKELSDTKEFKGATHLAMQKIEKDVQKLLKLLIAIRSPKYNSHSNEKNHYYGFLHKTICEFLDLIQTNLCPGIMTKAAKNLGEYNPKIIMEYYKLLLTYSRLSDLRHIPKRYKYLDFNQIRILEENPINGIPIQKYYANEIKKNHLIFSQSYQKLKNLDQDWKFWLEGKGKYQGFTKRRPRLDWLSYVSGTIY